MVSEVMTSPELGEMQTACQFSQKTRGSNIMVSDFGKEHGGYLQLTPEELEKAQATGIDIDNPEACEKIEYGENRDGYWTGEQFICQVEKSKLQR